jgi:hypothetical protein
MTDLKITSGQEWTFDMIEDVYNEIVDIITEKYQLTIYSNHGIIPTRSVRIGV